MQPVWKGPIEAGITQSLISNFLACPYRSYIQYGLGLEEPSQPEPNLFWGNAFHLGMELLLRRQERIKDCPPEYLKEVFNEIKNLLKKEYPMHPDTFPFSVYRMLLLYNDSFKDELDTIQTELKLKKEYVTFSGRKCTLRGKVDGLSGNTLIEHKSKGKIDSQQTKEETPVDLQTLLYCYCTGAREVIYDLVKIPEAQWKLPYRKQLEKASYYVDQMFDVASTGDFPIVRNKHLWLSQIPLTIDQESIDNMLKFTLDPIIDMIWDRYELWQRPDFDPDDPKFYGPLFYKVPIRQFDATRTERYKCSYHGFLTGQLTLDDLVPITSFYKELDA